eukprot:GHVU01105999.1.p3 GENE.GHVU01105999.1~~GHVU01105999.1.p3  ORF type:complete len:122 (+),score=8.24 GHVU01105999.1:672-1037(+)
MAVSKSWYGPDHRGADVLTAQTLGCSARVVLRAVVASERVPRRLSSASSAVLSDRRVFVPYTGHPPLLLRLALLHSLSERRPGGPQRQESAAAAPGGGAAAANNGAALRVLAPCAAAPSPP